MPVSGETFAFAIEGRPISKKNSRVLARGRSFPSAAYRRYQRDAVKQLSIARQQFIRDKITSFPLKPNYQITASFYFNGPEADGDNLLSSVFDVLQDAGIITDDKYVIRGVFAKKRVCPKAEQGVTILITPNI